MTKLQDGHETCDTCGKPYIALLGGKSCKCEVDAAHTDPAEKETALCIKYRQRARVAEAATEVEFKQLVITRKALCYIRDNPTDHHANMHRIAVNALHNCKKIQDKQLEDILGKPEPFLPQCKYQGNDTTVTICHDPESKHYLKPCSKKCLTPTKKGE